MDAGVSPDITAAALRQLGHAPDMVKLGLGGMGPGGAGKSLGERSADSSQGLTLDEWLEFLVRCGFYLYAGDIRRARAKTRVGGAKKKGGKSVDVGGGGGGGGDIDEFAAAEAEAAAAEAEEAEAEVVVGVAAEAEVLGPASQRRGLTLVHFSSQPELVFGFGVLSQKPSDSSLKPDSSHKG